MSVSSQQYADLAWHVYKPTPARSYDRDDESAPSIVSGGVHFYVRAHVDNPKTGYQGTIYQRRDTGEIIVAHRGTEFDREAYKDGALADGGMVLNRSNLQANDAIALTQRAIDLAATEASEKGQTPSSVTTTGHSLGGTLAQVSAHHFDLKGETFNAYGAASLGRRIPEGGHSVINHMMAGDAVSAASPHFGETRIYARQQEVDTLLAKGYDNKTHWSDPLRPYSPALWAAGMTPPSTLSAAVAMGGSHSMHHFVGVDAAGQADRSILADPQARSLAQQQSVQIGEYRQDVRQMRGVLTAVSRGLDGNVKDAIDTIRGPHDPGEPSQRDRKGASLDPAALPQGSRQLLDDSRDHVQRLAQQHGLPWDQGLENTVHALAQKASEAGLNRITHLKVDGGQIRFAEQDGSTLKEARIDARQAANTPVDGSVQRLATAPAPDAQTVAHADMSSRAPAMSRG
ncbi:MAG: lipase [Hydrogenophaga sp.]|uniref:XVIPCD domain-containing protein n=1 Tax=Hydrogenophaga sp. TaxID=1904254 RepID=UPI0025B7E179|nr:XVIPCD domain-containing protein [Hydrogenophaga sp.]MBT9553441.1 lipase [Hydrogenophaga sp.]